MSPRNFTLDLVLISDCLIKVRALLSIPNFHVHFSYAVGVYKSALKFFWKLFLFPVIYWKPFQTSSKASYFFQKFCCNNIFSCCFVILETLISRLSGGLESVCYHQVLHFAITKLVNYHKRQSQPFKIQ